MLRQLLCSFIICELINGRLRAGCTPTAILPRKLAEIHNEGGFSSAMWNWTWVTVAYSIKLKINEGKFNIHNHVVWEVCIYELWSQVIWLKRDFNIHAFTAGAFISSHSMYINSCIAWELNPWPYVASGQEARCISTLRKNIQCDVWTVRERLCGFLRLCKFT